MDYVYSIENVEMDLKRITGVKNSLTVLKN